MERLDLLHELFPCRATGMLYGDSRENFAAVVVDGLPATAGLLGLLSNRAMAMGEASGSIDDPAREGYSAHEGEHP